MDVMPPARDGAHLVADRARQWSDAALPVMEKPGRLPVIDLRRGELPRATAPHIIAAAAASLDRGETHYTPRPGIPALRRAVALRLATDDGVTYDPAKEVLIANGGQEGVYVAVQMLVHPGDDVLIAAPGYASFSIAVRLAGGNVVPVPVTAAENYGLTADAIATSLTPATRLLILASPNNPTGGVTTATEMGRIASLAEAHDLTVLFDETYRSFVFDGATHTSIAAFPGMRARTVIVGSFSKTYAMTGWRVGYVAADAALLGPITGLKLALSLCSAAPSQWAALAAIEGPQDDVTATLAELARRRAVLLPALTGMGLLHGGPKGAYYAFADIRSTGLSSDACAERFLTETGVRVLSGSRFGAGGEGFLRFSLVEPGPKIAEAMARLAPLVAQLQAAQVATQGRTS